MKKVINFLIIGILTFSFVTSCKDKEGKVMSLKEGQVVDSIKIKRLRIEETEEDPVIRSADPPIQIWYTGKKEIRWIQIVTKTEPNLKTISRPNFDGFISKKEYKELDVSLPSHKNNKLRREKRINDNNPFFPLRVEKKFHDAPWQGYTEFETYIILCEIDVKDNPLRWLSRPIGIWKWITKKSKQPKLIKIDASNNKFKNAFNAAVKDFDSSFKFNKWYQGKIPQSKL